MIPELAPGEDEEAEFARYAAELPGPSCLDAYELLVTDGRRRMLRLRRLAGSWEAVGAALEGALRQLDRELRHEVPDWPGLTWRLGPHPLGEGLQRVVIQDVRVMRSADRLELTGDDGGGHVLPGPDKIRGIRCVPAAVGDPGQ